MVFDHKYTKHNTAFRKGNIDNTKIYLRKTFIYFQKCKLKKKIIERVFTK